MEQLSIPYFRDLLSRNVSNLKNLCEEWEVIHTDLSIPDEVRDEIRSTIAFTNLLMRQKLKQFGGLIDDSEFKRGEKEITCLDLQGFWDMVYNEVEKIQKKFLKLEKCQKNNWVFVEEATLKVENKKKLLPAIAKASVTTKQHASAARQRLAEAKLKMKAQMAAQKSEDVIKTDINSKTKNKDQNLQNKEKISSPSKNMHTSETREQNIKVNSSKKAPSSKTKSTIKVIGNQDKENVLTQVPSNPEGKLITPSIRKRRGKSKDVIPLQCLTRSAKKALLAKQNAVQKD